MSYEKSITFDCSLHFGVAYSFQQHGCLTSVIRHHIIGPVLANRLGPRWSGEVSSWEPRARPCTVLYNPCWSYPPTWSLGLLLSCPLHLTDPGMHWALCRCGLNKKELLSKTLNGIFLSAPLPSLCTKSSSKPEMTKFRVSVKEVELIQSPQETLSL